jgi:uncharacterized CHY-type Zn-finger protein
MTELISKEQALATIDAEIESENVKMRECSATLNDPDYCATCRHRLSRLSGISFVREILRSAPSVEVGVSECHHPMSWKEYNEAAACPRCNAPRSLATRI